VNTARGQAPGQFNPATVLTADAVIFAAGGAHNELGDVEHMLSGPYFPHANLTMDDDLQASLRNYYDFLAAYENLLRDVDVEPSDATASLPGIRAGADGAGDTVWTFAKRKGDTTILHFINLLGTADTGWADPEGLRVPPPRLENVTVRHHYQGSRPTKVLVASPDGESAEARTLDYTAGADTEGPYVEFQLPSLRYWDMVWFR
jgi:dextranase